MKTTKTQFDLFVVECMAYQEKFHLMEWELDFAHIDLEEGTVARVTSSPINMNVIARFCKNHDRKISNEEISEIAKHEMLHVFLAPLTSLAQSRFITTNEIDINEHAIIQKLMRLMPTKLT